jgi:hypothetical protein
MKIIAAGIAIGFAVVVAVPPLYVVYLVQDDIPAYIAQAWEGLKLCGGAAILFALATGAYLWRRQSHEQLRQRDGAFALQVFWLQPLLVRWLFWLQGKPAARVIYDHNTNPDPAAIVADKIYYVPSPIGPDRQLAYVTTVEGTRKLQAIAPGDTVRSLPWGGTDNGKLAGNVATAKLMAGHYDKPPKPIQVEAPPAAPQLPPPVPLSLPDALEQTTHNHWLLGQNKDTGALAVWTPDNTPHLAVIGGSGSGKSESTVSQLIVAARRCRWQPIILDPVGGADLSVFRDVAEWQETSADVITDQLQVIAGAMDERVQLVKAAGVPRIGELSSPPPHVLVLIDEFGLLMSALRGESRATAEAILDRIVRVGRKYGVHLAVADQTKSRWPEVTARGIAPTLTYRMGDYGGQAYKAYNADTLGVGQFELGRTTYNAWHVTPQLSRILPSIPALSGRMLDGRSSVPGVAGDGDLRHVERQERPQNVPSGTERGTAPDIDAPGRWDDVVAAWFAAHPGALTGPALGISDLARAMCRDNEGSEVNYEAYKGRAHKLFHEFRAAVRLPGGDRFGTDISTPEARL